MKETNRTIQQVLASLIICTTLFSIPAKAQDSIQSTIQIRELIVTGTRNETDVRNLPSSITVVTEKQLHNRQIQSVLPLLNEQVPGLFITSRGIMGYGVSTGAAGAMRLRGIGGSPTTGILVLIDGEPQYMGLMGHPLADVYQTTMADRVEVIRGPASALYGSNAMGGVINIVTSKLKKDTVLNHARFSYGSFNTLETSYTNRIHKGRFSSKTSVSYNRTDGQRENMEFEQFSGNAKAGYNLSNAWNVNVNLVLSQFKASNPGTITTPVFDNDSRITRGSTILSVENNYQHTSGALKAYYNWGNHLINDGYQAGKQPLDYRFHSNDNMAGISLYQSATFMANNRITVGADYQQFGGKAWNKYTNNTEAGIIDTTLHEIAAYADVRQSIGSFLTLNAAMRYDYHSKSGGKWIPQFGMAVHIPKIPEMKATISKGFRNPAIRELFMFPPKNANLLPEELLNYELSFSQYLLNRSLFYHLSVFYMDGKNMIQTVFANGKPLNVNSGKVRNHGIEAVLNYKLTPQWSINANYSWLYMKYPVLAAPEHKAYVGLDYSHNRLMLSAGIHSIHGLYSSVTPIKKENFLLLNARGNYRIMRFISIFVAGENLLNKSYQINAGYPMPGATVSGGCNVQF
ncbi:MAG: TonB-dependent receptor [Paludibacter sp.]